MKFPLLFAFACWMCSPVNFAQADDVAGVPVRLNETTGTYLFDESINHQVGFTISQEDPRLKDLFDSHNKSPLCVPTSFSMMAAYLKFWREPAFPNLQMDVDPLAGDFSQVVREFAKRFDTNRTTGTELKNVYEAIKEYASDSNLNNSEIRLIGVDGGGEDHRPVTVDDIRSFVQKDYGTLISFHYFKYDPIAKAWVGAPVKHAVQLVGYDYNLSWGDSQIVLKIVNPEVDYRTRDPKQRWDSIDMMKIPPHRDEKYPSTSSYFINGNAAKGVEIRGFIWNLTAFLPK